MEKLTYKVTIEPEQENKNGDITPQEPKRYTRLPNPSILISEYNLASEYCYRFQNMTRQDWMELAIIEKLHNDGQLPDEAFNARYNEIRSRPPRGLRKGTKNKGK